MYPFLLFTQRNVSRLLSWLLPSKYIMQRVRTCARFMYSNCSTARSTIRVSALPATRVVLSEFGQDPRQRPLKKQGKLLQFSVVSPTPHFQWKIAKIHLEFGRNCIVGNQKFLPFFKCNIVDFGEEMPEIQVAMLGIYWYESYERLKLIFSV